MKFAAPVVVDVIDRPRLHARLTAGAEHPVTVIAAAAGWGKTLLAASWVGTGAGGRAAVWVSLDKGDDGPRSFWSTLGTALLPVTGPASGAVLRRVVADEGADAEDLPGRFAAGMRLAERPVLLVLDNLHEVNSPGRARRPAAAHPSDPRRPSRCWLSPVAIRRGRSSTCGWPGCSPRSGTDDLGFTANEAAALFARLRRRAYRGAARADPA